MNQMLVDQSDQALRIWVADGDPNEHLLMALAADGFPDIDLHFVTDGQQLMVALNRLDDVELLPDLIVLDLHMSPLGGHATLDDLHRHPVFGQIPVMVLSSSTQPNDRFSSLLRGASWYETKPSCHSGLTEVVERMVVRARHENDVAPSDEGRPDATRLDRDGDIFDDLDDLFSWADLEVTGQVDTTGR